jgi:hypothetical protein
MTEQQIFEIKQSYAQKLHDAFITFCNALKDYPMQEQYALRGLGYMNDGFVLLKEAITNSKIEGREVQKDKITSADPYINELLKDGKFMNIPINGVIENGKG